MERLLPPTWISRASSNGFAKPLVIQLKNDEHLAVFNHVIHLTTCALLGYVALPWPMTLLFASAVVVSYRAFSRIHVRRTHPQAVVSLTLETDDSWTLYRRNGEVLKNMRIETCWLKACCILARFSNAESGGCSVILTQRSTDSDSLRRLRLYLLI